MNTNNPMVPRHERPLVLIVDDDETSLLLARVTLEEAGFLVEEAHNGREAVEVFTLRRPKIVMMDVMMPEMDGYEACRLIRALPFGANTPIIMVTGLDDLDSINRAYEVGATEFTTKPINWAIEVHRVRYMLRAADALEELKERESQLRQSQKMEAIGRLAGGVAHDFNNLLTVILSYADLAAQEVDDKTMLTECLSEVRDAGQRAATLTRQLLAFSRKQMLQPKLISINQLIQQMEKMLRRLIPANINIATKLPHDLDYVMADPGQMEQVVMNLVINAGDAMPHGGQLLIETCNYDLDMDYTRDHAQVKSGRYVMLAISDTGVGMTPDIKSQIFEPFFTTKGLGKGTGLGLSMVYGIVNQSNGHIWVYSEPGAGTTFKIYLPASTERPAEAVVAPLNPSGNRGHEVILLVEDEESVRRAVATTLERNGYRVIQAEDGMAALSLAELQGEQIHVLVSDLVMPRMGGRELADRLSRRFPHIRQIFISGYTENRVLEQYMKDHEAHFIQKPFKLEVLTSTIREVLSRAPQPKPAAPVAQEIPS